MKSTRFLCGLAMAGTLSIPSYSVERDKVAARLDASAGAITEMMRASDKGIPQNLLNKSYCVVVVPGMKKAGFIAGAQYGRGFASCHHSGEGWSAPAAIRMEGGSVGFQIGATETDVILLVMNYAGMQHLLSDKFTIGGDVTGAAGPIGRELSAETDASLKTEMLSYSRSHGVFAGISLEGATLRPDRSTDRELYGRDMTNRDILDGEFEAPAVARRFQHILNQETIVRG